MNELVSVIIPLFNRISFIEATLASIAHQKYNHLEVIIIDDGSTDGSADYAISVMDKCNLKGKVITIKNSGPDAARDFGITRAKGSILAFLDSDDIWSPDYLEEMVNALNQDDKYLWAFSDFYLTDARATPVAVKSKELKLIQTLLSNKLDVETYLISVNLFTYLLQEQPIFPSGLIIRRCLYDQMGTFTKHIQQRILSLEWEFMLRCAKAAPVVYVQKPLVFIRKHEGNISGALVKQEEGEIAVLQTVLNTYNLTHKEKRIVHSEIARRSWNVGYHYYLTNNSKLSRSWFIGSFNQKNSLTSVLFIVATYLPSSIKRTIRKVRKFCRPVPIQNDI
jgi:glycosyltransferase involved in cell wall biosynthesis